MRLVDADAIKQKYPNRKSLNQVLDAAPTAFDVDKVVEQIEFLQDNSFQNGIYNTYQNAIEIVKDGGLNEID